VNVHARRHIRGPPSTSRSVLNFTGGEIIPIYLRLEQQLRQGRRGQRPHHDLLPELGGDRQCRLSTPPESVPFYRPSFAVELKFLIF
jgi:hypothetical protein